MPTARCAWPRPPTRAPPRRLRPAGSAGRRARGHQGPVRHRRPDRHRRLAGLAPAARHDHLDRRRQAAGGRHGAAGQAAHGRVRLRRLGHQSRDGHAAQPLGSGTRAHSGRLVQRLGRGRGRRPGARRAGLRYRWLGAYPGGAQRRHRPEDHARADQPAWRGAAVRHAGLHRSADARRARRIAADAGHGRRRSQDPLTQGVPAFQMPETPAGARPLRGMRIASDAAGAIPDRGRWRRAGRPG